MTTATLTRHQLLSEARQWEMAADRVGSMSRLQRATSRSYRDKARELRQEAQIAQAKETA